MPMKTGNVVLDKSFAFALSIISYCETLEQNKKFVISNQLLKSGTSIGAKISMRHRTVKVGQILFIN